MLPRGAYVRRTRLPKNILKSSVLSKTNDLGDKLGKQVQEISDNRKILKRKKVYLSGNLN